MDLNINSRQAALYGGTTLFALFALAVCALVDASFALGVVKVTTIIVLMLGGGYCLIRICNLFRTKAGPFMGANHKHGDQDGEAVFAFMLAISTGASIGVLSASSYTHSTGTTLFEAFAFSLICGFFAGVFTLGAIAFNHLFAMQVVRALGDEDKFTIENVYARKLNRRTNRYQPTDKVIGANFMRPTSYKLCMMLPWLVALFVGGTMVSHYLGTPAMINTVWLAPLSLAASGFVLAGAICGVLKLFGRMAKTAPKVPEVRVHQTVLLNGETRCLQQNRNGGFSFKKVKLDRAGDNMTGLSVNDTVQVMGRLGERYRVVPAGNGFRLAKIND